MANAYFDQKLKPEAVRQQLSKLGGKKKAVRGDNGVVYTLRNGEALVEAAAGNLLRLRLFAGKCPC